ncbi:histone-lysine N-methyltransferase, H3 lysine-9 specific SUVH5-like [Beta vulgaris subsp. vulgaris]|uniref:histone-lysine N-methyltransferase, H3 lysine-9 specific SUVH5-like n=1 Tax=Beta vulgaris subsp. vulgaris TaxID=3555 RepID=UPI002036F96D|nr:histone-lysine N-methyltransferase, H3 lysine-9 specific SUVH5-like [Beta vulgaris subsp. vulgaris]
MNMFRNKCNEIRKSRGTTKCFKTTKRIDSIAKVALTKQGKLCISSSKILGPIPGVHVGDRFEYRIELTIVGLHSRNEHGIDYMEHPKIFNKTVATCVVAKEGCKDEINDNDEVITYIGEGGIVRNKQRDYCPKDQKLTKGNLAMVNSFFINNDVRVVRGINVAPNKTAYVYDGLYKVMSYKQKIEPAGNLIFEFKLVRSDGQTVVPWNELKSNASFGMFC